MPSWKHGESYPITPEYEAWKQMKRRCFNVNCAAYPEYGGRGISVFHGWIGDYLSFLSHMGRRPSSAHSVDRIDCNGNYEPGNVRWAIPEQQSRNTRRNVFTYEGTCLKDAARDAGVNYAVALWRFNKKGLSLEDALSNEPIRKVATHCKVGHELAGDNLYIAPNGSRACKICRREAGRRCDKKRNRAEYVRLLRARNRERS